MAMQPLALEAGIRDGAGRGLSRRLRRPALALAIAALAIALPGDRSRAAGVPAGVAGQDPLEVLELKVRPNVILVLDTSGSMTGTVGTSQTGSGDHPRSRFYQAKQAVKSVIQNNQDKVSFQFGTYTEFEVPFNNKNATTTGRRFQYWTSDQLSPSMATTELTVQGAYQDGFGRGLQSWQIIKPEWGTLYFEEDADGSGSVDASVCSASLPGLPKFYARGGSGSSPAVSTSPQNLAFELQTVMNGASCAGGSRTNTYSVTYDTTTGRFTFERPSGTRQWRILWGQGPNNIRNALAETSTSTTSWQDSGSVTTDAPWRLLYRTTTASSGFGSFKWNESIGTTTVINYQLQANRLWNGEVVRVMSDGSVCGMTFPTPTEKTNPPSLTLQLVAADCGADQTDRVTFSFAGGSYGASSVECAGFRSKSSLIPCDLQSPPAQLQTEMIGPYLDNQLPFAATGDPADWTTNGAADGSAGDSVPDGVPDYVETQDGSWAVEYVWVAPSAKTTGNTPIANSLIDIKGTADASDTCLTTLTTPPPLPGKYDSLSATATLESCVEERGFTKLWKSGQTGATAMAGPGPWQISAIKDHGVCDDGTTYPTPCATPRKPKEKTIVLFVTDGDDTCFTRTGGSNGDPNALRAAYWAARLYEPIDANDAASSVQTYIIGYGNGATPKRLNWIAWGGSGLGQGGSSDPLFIANDGNRWTESTTNITTKRALCETCVDAFIAPDAATLKSQLQGIIDQGASDGDFNAQQSITESVYEYVHLAATATVLFDAAKPGLRYRAIVPTRFVSSFSLPGFKGQQRAYQNDGSGGSVERWSAGAKLRSQVATAMVSGDLFTSGCDTTAEGGGPGECAFNQLHGGADDTNIRTSSARIKRRIYTTSGNGVFPYTVAKLIDGTATDNATSTGRVALWPPTTPGLLPSSLTDNSAQNYDGALGLPPDAPTGFPPNPVDPKCDPADTRPIATPKKAYDVCWLEWLQDRFQACRGSNLPSACTDSSITVKLAAARREAREIALAFLAGAATVPDPVVTGLKRTNASSLLYTARSWILGDSELATAAVVTPPLPAEPTATPYLDEYRLFRDGPRSGGSNPERSAAAPVQVKMGFGLTNPDNDGSVAGSVVDTQAGLKPVMTVLYAPANDMLHAFRAGPCDTPALTVPCDETGGEELWGFVPYDQLHTVLLRAAHEPQGRGNHVYSLARGVRFSDVFVPGAYSRSVGSGTVASTQGVWRRVLFIPRGIGGKYVTALDVTAPGPFTEYALDTRPPEPLWSRGNPDTRDGLVTGTRNGDGSDFTAYSKMGETWSIPVVAYVDKANPIYNGLDYVLYMGSGYSSIPGEGTTFYTLDALSGKVVAAADVGSRAGFAAYPNALVANAVGFNPKIFSPLTTVHPAASQVKRVYIGDVHGRVWKFLTARPDVALPLADLGADQPVGAAVSLIGMPPQPGTPVPHVFVTSGADRRAAGPFQMFAFRDDGTDTDTAVGAGSTAGTVTTFLPAVQLFARFFDQGTPEASCGYTTEAVFRGTVQPAAAFECSSISVGTCANPVGRIFYAGTRLSLPNTKFAPITPLACGSGVYPCRSQFDSILYALGATTGLPAYDLNASGDDAYRIFRDSRIAAITVQADPDPGRGGSSFAPDEGLMKGIPKPPPPPGVPPTTTTATANVVLVREAGRPAPAILYGSTVCQ
jgi:hypothetical protein